MNQQQAGYREVEHTADWELEVWALDLKGLLEQSARGMYELAGMRLQPEPRLERSLALIADDPETLLVKFLSELLYFTEQEQIGFTEYMISLEGCSLHASLEAGPVASLDKEIKAVTYHRLAVRQVDGMLRVNIVFDV
jgi:SHS2 domain-containing protein